jgi:hypothetical protein
VNFLETFAEFGLSELQKWAAARKLSCGLEQSVRMSPGILETRRCLLLFSLLDAGHETPRDILHSCRIVNASEMFQQSIARFINAADSPRRFLFLNPADHSPCSGAHRHWYRPKR